MANSKSYTVNLIPQHTKTTCWYAACCMLLDWGVRNGYRSDPLGFLTYGQSFWRSCGAEIKMDGTGTSLANAATLFSFPNYSTNSPASIGAWRNLINQSPIVYRGRVKTWRNDIGGVGSGFHAVVITGYYEEDDELFLDIVDPFPVLEGTGEMTMSLSEFQTALEPKGYIYLKTR